MCIRDRCFPVRFRGGGRGVTCAAVGSLPLAIFGRGLAMSEVGFANWPGYLGDSPGIDQGPAGALPSESITIYTRLNLVVGIGESVAFTEDAGSNFFHQDDGVRWNTVHEKDIGSHGAAASDNSIASQNDRT